MIGARSLPSEPVDNDAEELIADLEAELAAAAWLEANPDLGAPRPPAVLRIPGYGIDDPIPFRVVRTA